jgi:putative membrane protein
MTESYNDVSKIHKRYSLTLLTPSSKYHSLIFSAIISSITGYFILTSYFDRADELAYKIPILIGVLLITQKIDARLIRNREYSKALHMSLFGNMSWLAIVLMGLAALSILGKLELSLLYVVEGMMIFTSFRIGLLTTTLGLSMRKAWAICFIQPMAMYLVLIPQDQWITSLTDPIAMGLGATFLAIASIWSYLTDRAGRPEVKSTHQLIQAYLASRGRDNYEEVESIIESRSNPSSVVTSQIRFQSNNSDFRMVLPEVHPGPYHPIGGSNITYRIYKTLNSSAMVMHSVSDHALNLPSQNAVNDYLGTFSTNIVLKKGTNCTEPVTVTVNKARVTGILFDKTAILFLSLSPHGMEDVPSSIKKEIKQLASNRDFERILVVDCHNAMGEEIGQEDSQDMLKAAKATLESLVTKESYPLEFGYANSNNMDVKSLDLGPGGLGILCMKINGKKFFLGWSDSNNMENGTREHVVSHFAKNGMSLVELCTSDTHFSSTVVRTRTGYYPFGKISTPDTIANWYYTIAKQAEAKLEPTSFEILEHKAQVRVMGTAVLEDFSKALDRSLLLTKGFAIGSFLIFIGSLFL